MVETCYDIQRSIAIEDDASRILEERASDDCYSIEFVPMKELNPIIYSVSDVEAEIDRHENPSWMMEHIRSKSMCACASDCDGRHRTFWVSLHHSMRISDRTIQETIDIDEQTETSLLHIHHFTSPIRTLLPQIYSSIMLTIINIHISFNIDKEARRIR